MPTIRSFDPVARMYALPAGNGTLARRTDNLALANRGGYFSDNLRAKVLRHGSTEHEQACA